MVLVVYYGLPLGLCSSNEASTRASSSTSGQVSDAVAGTVPVLRDFQVYPPVLTPTSEGEALTNGTAEDVSATVPGGTDCISHRLLMEYTFASSYGAPFVGQYTPPSCDFNRVTLNFTVTSIGRQFDRLAVMYLGDIEIWRTSTAEPTATGIVWTYIKDVSEFKTLFSQRQKVIFDLGNQVTDVYTASFNTTLTATFFKAQDTIDPADVILPVSARQAANNMPSAYQVPTQNASNSLTLPRNVEKAVFSISATGQIDEEFWYSNALSSDVNTFPGYGPLLGSSPYREVQLLIDGKLAGVVLPFPIIFTGGVVPGLWRPLVGIDAFDLREDEIDITAWLPLLCDGSSHTFSIIVAGIDDDGKGNGVITDTIGSYWIVTGKVFLWLDEDGSMTSGTMPESSVPAPSIALSSSVGKSRNGTNETLAYDVAVNRELNITSTVKTSRGSKLAVWHQISQYENRNVFTNRGNSQFTQQTASGVEVSSRGYARRFSYPITLNQTVTQPPNGNLTLQATLDRGEDIHIAGQPTFPTGLQSFDNLPRVSKGPAFQGSHLSTRQNGSAFYTALPNNTQAFSFGSTQQEMTFAGIQVDSFTGDVVFPPVSGSFELYQRHVLAINSTVAEDNENLVGASIASFVHPPSAVPPALGQFAEVSIGRTHSRPPQY
ncbi:MAG: hypothetical protein M1828_007318 [Chrysothrix sp. TS-e1954]|nr:MAG: hypothetical protein M1828_007318 [Chrysothrix sp. TS-e1954]